MTVSIKKKKSYTISKRDSISISFDGAWVKYNWNLARCAWNHNRNPTTILEHINTSALNIFLLYFNKAISVQVIFWKLFAAELKESPK